MKKLLIVLITIVILTGCTEKNTDVNENVHYAYGIPTMESPTNYRDVMASSESNSFVKLEDKKLSVCIHKNNKLECFEHNNYEEEKAHMQNIFEESECTSDEYGVYCTSNEFFCYAFATGLVGCDDKINNLYCIIDIFGDVDCYNDNLE